MVDDEDKGTTPHTESMATTSEEEKQSIWGKVLDSLERIAGRRKNLITFFGIIIIPIIGLVAFMFIPQGYFFKPQGETQKLPEAIRKFQKEEIVQEVLKQISAKDFKNAPKETKQAIENVRKNPQTALLGKAISKAISLQEKKEFNKAAAKWRAIAKVAEGNDDDLAAKAWFSVGYLLTEQGKREEGIEAFSEAIRLRPNHDGALLDRGVSKTVQQQYKAAVVDFSKVINLRPNYAVAYNNRGAAKAAQGQCKAAIKDYDKALRLKPDYAAAYNNRGSAKIKLKKFTAAIADFNDAIRLKADYAEAYNNRGVAKIRLGRKDEARQDIEKAHNLARKADDKKLIDLAEQKLRELDEQ